MADRENHEVISVEKLSRRALEKVLDEQQLKEPLEAREIQAAQMIARVGKNCKFCQKVWDPRHEGSDAHMLKVQERFARK